jgi:hypothetical protein
LPLGLGDYGARAPAALQPESRHVST